MSDDGTPDATRGDITRGDVTRKALEAVYRSERRRVLATLIRVLGGFDAAEEALQEAFVAAANQWPSEGIPKNPYAWLVSVGRFRSIDRWRRQGRLSRALPALAVETDDNRPDLLEDSEDDELRLLFTCCHPALPPDARIALALREVCGLTTEEIASAYLTRASTIAQRIVRAKAKIRDEGIPYDVPELHALGARRGPSSSEPSPNGPSANGPAWEARLESVLRVLYLLFNEGYAATEGASLVRADLSGEAIRLGRRLARRLDDPEVLGLLALMLLHESRRAARTDDAGDLVLLEHQDRSTWDHDLIAEASALLTRALAARRAGPYLVQAAIAEVHAAADSVETTDWAQIVALYDVLARVEPSPVVALNRAVALGMRDGPEAGLVALDALLSDGALDAYPLAHAARADLLRRLGRTEAARAAYTRALELTRQEAERRFLQARLEELSGET